MSLDIIAISSSSDKTTLKIKQNTGKAQGAFVISTGLDK